MHGKNTFTDLKKNGKVLTIHILDNEYSYNLKTTFTNTKVNYQLSPLMYISIKRPKEPFAH